MTSQDPFLPNNPRVVVAYDYFTQRGGAERVALEPAHQLNAARIMTPIHRPDRTFDRVRQATLRKADSS